MYLAKRWKALECFGSSSLMNFLVEKQRDFDDSKINTS
jgi:hypothetical protein